MSPETRQIDRVFPGVGRIALRSGTTHAGTFKRINAMLSALYALGDLDTLKGIKDRVWTPLVVLHAYERGQLGKLTRDTTALLVPALKKFHATHEAGASYRSDVMTSIRHIERAAPKDATVQALPAIVRAMKDDFRARPVAFNRLRTHCLAFASELTGKHSPLWVELTRINRFKKAEGLRPKTLQRRPLTVAELDAVCQSFEDHVVYGGRKGAANKGRKTIKRTIYGADLANMARTLATTGMRPAEYWQREGAGWEARYEPSRIQVLGTKTAAARRPTFLLSVTAPACGEQFFRARFAEATTKAVREGLDCYSLRRTFAKLCEDAGVVESRRQAYLGHGPKTVTDLYLQTNVLPFVEADAALVAAWIEREREAAKRPQLTVAR